MDHPQKHVEQFEIIERNVIESRRPLTTKEALNYVPTSYTQTSTENFINKNFEPLNSNYNFLTNSNTNKYYLTGENEKETSVFYNSSQSPIPATTNQYFQKENNKNNLSEINNYGYDLHEIHTNNGGAKIVQTHGSGQLFPNNKEIITSDKFSNNSYIKNDRSLNVSSLQSNENNTSQIPSFVTTPTNFKNSFIKQSEIKQPVTLSIHHVTADASGSSFSPNLEVSANNSDQLHSILKNTDSWTHNPSSHEKLFSRKDSYKRMQESQTDNGFTSALSCGTLNSKSSQKQFILPQENSKNNSIIKNSLCWKLIEKFYNNNLNKLKEIHWTPRLIGSIFIVLSLIFVFFFILWLIFNSIFSKNFKREYLLYPPVCEECLKQNPNSITYRLPSKLFVHLSGPSQVYFELIGNPPFKSNSFTAINFDTGYIAIADHALTDANGKHTTCFLMDIDRNSLPNINILIDALDNTNYEVKTEFGWQNYWQFNAELIDESNARSRFKDEIEECKDAKWYYLKHTVYTKDSSCSTCYDFCLPDYAVLKRKRYEDYPSLGIRRLNCFRFFVPEWRMLYVETDETGGHWKYPNYKKKIEFN